MTDFLEEYRQRRAEAGTACGPHCPGNRIPLTPYEVARIAEGLGITTGEVIRRYLRPGSAVLATKEDGSCVFHQESGCELERGRPMSCRSFAEEKEAAGVFLLRARQYREVLRAWARTRERAGMGSHEPESADAGETVTVHPAPELGTWLLDVDAAVAERCAEKGIPVPTDVEARVDIHLEVLRAALE